MNDTREILQSSPAPFRPVVPSLRPLLQSIILNTPYSPALSSTPSSANQATTLNSPLTVKVTAADLLASLHLTSGKAQASQAWAADMSFALGSIDHAMEGIIREGWLEVSQRFPSPQGAPPVGLPALPLDTSARLNAALDIQEGGVEILLGLLRGSSRRPVPVPVPLSSIVHSSLRMLNLTLETPVAQHISPHHHAELITALPRLWTCGLLVLGGAMSASVFFSSNVCGR